MQRPFVFPLSPHCKNNKASCKNNVRHYLKKVGYCLKNIGYCFAPFCNHFSGRAFLLYFRRLWRICQVCQKSFGKQKIRRIKCAPDLCVSRFE